MLRGSIVEEVVRASGHIDVHVITGDLAPDADPVRRGPTGSTPLRRYVLAGATVALVTCFTGALRSQLLLPDVVAIYLGAIMVLSVRFPRGPAFFASVLSVAAYDVFFIPPFYTLTVNDLRHVLTFAMMFVTALLISTLTSRIRKQELAAQGRVERTAALLNLSRALGVAEDEKQAARAATEQLVSAFGGGSAVYVKRDTGVEVLSHIGQLDLGEAEESVVMWVLEHRKPAGRGTDTLPGARARYLPIATPERALGVLALSPHLASTLSGDQRAFVEAFVRQLAVALERAQLGEEARAAALRARTEEMRSSILSAVSHDLRTPLGTITGAATALRDQAGLPRATTRDLVDTICEEAERLERLVSNLVEMTRIESGAVTPKREWVPLEEIIGVALSRLESNLRGRRVATKLPDDLPLICVDPILIEQVLINLLDNAAKYSPAGTPIEIHAQGNGTLAVEVRDRGSGLPQGDEATVFERFFRHGGTSGVGLGLSICKAIVEVHGGRIMARQREDGGAVFRLELPLSETGPPAAPEAESSGASALGRAP